MFSEVENENKRLKEKIQRSERATMDEGAFSDGEGKNWRMAVVMGSESEWTKKSEKRELSNMNES